MIVAFCLFFNQWNFTSVDITFIYDGHEGKYVFKNEKYKNIPKVYGERERLFSFHKGIAK